MSSPVIAKLGKKKYRKNGRKSEKNKREQKSVTKKEKL